MYKNSLKAIARVGLTKDLKSARISSRTAVSIQKAVDVIQSNPESIKRNSKVKKVGENVYSYRLNMTDRLLFGVKDNKCVVLDVLDLRKIK